jgi:hypothetical protein
MAAKTYHGSCDCGKVRFEAVLDFAEGTFKCNCRICWKLRFWGIRTTAANFKLLSGEADLTRYGLNKIHRFCRHCGVKVFGGPADGTRVAVNVAALDDLPPEELAAAPVTYVDGLHDNWKEAPRFTAHL